MGGFLVGKGSNPVQSQSGSSDNNPIFDSRVSFNQHPI
jgi:hypothetical protein